MQITKSSTSNDVDHQKLLDILLAIIHRDYGQYTILAGYQVSVEDAITKVLKLRLKKG